MNYASFDISLAAVIPALILAIYIFISDKVEKEPLWLLALLFASGAVLYFPANYAQTTLIGAFDSLFADHITYTLEGVASFSSNAVKYGHGALCVFVGVALIEELAKWCVLVLLTHKNKNFNCLFDGIVYSAFVSLGFAAIENLRYAWTDGWDTLLLRTLTSLPGHLYFGVIMGFCYTMWNSYRLAEKKEIELHNSDRITIKKPFHAIPWLVLSLVLPILIHGVFSFAGYYNSEILNMIYYIFNGILFVGCFIGITKMSRTDAENNTYVDRILKKKYPELQNSNNESGVN